MLLVSTSYLWMWIYNYLYNWQKNWFTLKVLKGRKIVYWSACWFTYLVNISLKVHQLHCLKIQKQLYILSKSTVRSQWTCILQKYKRTMSKSICILQVSLKTGRHNLYMFSANENYSMKTQTIIYLSNCAKYFYST